MAIKISSTSVISNARQLQNIASLDATTTSTIAAAVPASAPTTAQVGTAYGGLAALAVGSICPMAVEGSRTIGGNVAGSNLRYNYNTTNPFDVKNQQNSLPGTAPSGTWKNIGGNHTTTAGDGATNYNPSLYLRIS